MVSQAETVRGNERIQQLMEEFPEIHRTVVVKTDLLREGIRPSAGSRLAGRWALPDAKWYFEYSKEDTHTPEEATAGYILSPLIGNFSNEVAIHFMWDTRSPYEVRYEEKGRYRLYRDGEAIEELFFAPRPQWYDKKTSSGKPMPSVLAMRGEDYMLFMAVLTYCEYGKDNRTCRYCNINSSESVKKDLGLERITAKREEDVYETCVAVFQESKPRQVNMSGGVILDSSKEAEVYARMLKAVKRAMKDVGVQVPIGVSCQAMGPEDQVKLKEAGASDVNHNMEVWDPKMFEIICPGKAKYVGREKWIEAVLSSKKIFGSASTAFVVGVEMVPPYGFKTEDEAAESVLEGWEWLMARGVRGGDHLWRPAPGTEFAGLPAPRTEYSLRMGLANHKLAQKYNLAPEPGRPSQVGHTIDSDLADVAVEKREVPVVGPSTGRRLSRGGLLSIARRQGAGLGPSVGVWKRPGVK